MITRTTTTMISSHFMETTLPAVLSARHPRRGARHFLLDQIISATSRPITASAMKSGTIGTVTGPA